jgi:hypothetical protein
LWALGSLATILAQVGDLDQARALVTTAIASALPPRQRGEANRVRTLLNMAQALARNGAAEQARVVAREGRAIADRIERWYGLEQDVSSPLGEAPITQAMLGDLDQALSVQDAFLPPCRSPLLRSMVEALAQNGEPRAAQDVAAKIPEPKDRAVALIAVARAFVAKGNRRRAVSLLNDAVAAAREGRYSQVVVLSEVVPLLVDAGATRRARKVLSDIQSLAAAISGKGWDSPLGGVSCHCPRFGRERERGSRA